MPAAQPTMSVALGLRAHTTTLLAPAAAAAAVVAALVLLRRRQVAATLPPLDSAGARREDDEADGQPPLPSIVDDAAKELPVGGLAGASCRVDAYVRPSRGSTFFVSVPAGQRLVLDVTSQSALLALYWRGGALPSREVHDGACVHAATLQFSWDASKRPARPTQLHILLVSDDAEQVIRFSLRAKLDIRQQRSKRTAPSSSTISLSEAQQRVRAMQRVLHKLRTDERSRLAAAAAAAQQQQQQQPRLSVRMLEARASSWRAVRRLLGTS